MTAPSMERATILGMTNPIAQRYAFARYVLSEPRMDAAAIAGRFQSLGLMTADEYDTVSRGWS